MWFSNLSLDGALNQAKALNRFNNCWILQHGDIFDQHRLQDVHTRPVTPDATLNSPLENIPEHQLQLRPKYKGVLEHQYFLHQANIDQYWRIDMESNQLHQYAHHRSIGWNQSKKLING